LLYSFEAQTLGGDAGRVSGMADRPFSSVPRVPFGYTTGCPGSGLGKLKLKRKG
jgi:hypothetical protein